MAGVFPIDELAVAAVVKGQLCAAAEVKDQLCAAAAVKCQLRALPRAGSLSVRC